MATIRVNSTVVNGSTLVITNGKIIVDGKSVEMDDKNITINVVGNLDSLEVDVCDKLSITGDVGSVKTISGDVSCGNVHNSVNTVSGDVRAVTIHGSTNTVSGDIKTK